MDQKRAEEKTTDTKPKGCCCGPRTRHEAKDVPPKTESATQPEQTAGIPCAGGTD
jgi:hypothetical protein